MDRDAAVFLRAYCQITIVTVAMAINPTAYVCQIQFRAPEARKPAQDTRIDEATTTAARIKTANNKWTNLLVITESAAAGNTNTAVRRTWFHSRPGHSAQTENPLARMTTALAASMGIFTNVNTNSAFAARRLFRE